MRNCLFIIFIITLSSCALFGSKYKRPDIAQNNNWNESATNIKIIKTDLHLNQYAWWLNFNDKNLNSLVDLALQNNNDIQIAEGNILDASAKLKQIQMNWVPTLNLGGAAAFGSTFNASNSSGVEQLNNFSSGIGANTNSNNFNFYSLGLIPSYSLNLVQQFKQQDLAKYNLNLTYAQQNAIRLTILNQVIGAYFTLIALNTQLEVQKTIINNLTTVIKLVSIAKKEGIATSNDVLRYTQELAKAKAQLPNFNQNIVLTKNVINTLTNQNIHFTYKHTLLNINTNKAILANMPSIILNNRPDVIIAEEQLKIANANIGIAKANFFPKITLTTPVGGYSAQLANLFNSKGDFWAVQILATMPILNLSLYELVKQSKAKYYVAYYNYVKTTKTAFADVNNNLSNYEQIQKVFNDTQNYYFISQKIANNDFISYKNGYATYVQSINSKIDADNALIHLIQVKLQQIQAITSFYQAIASGYDYKNTHQIKQFHDDRDF